jgi:hypothetical protein
MQEYQENYNDSEAFASPDMQGDGYSNVGRNYSPAWGGQFQSGGFLQPTSIKLPEGYVIPYNTPSTELSMSIGGEEGEPAYLIPSFKYGKLLKDPVSEYRKTGEHLGGPFKTWQEAEKFAEMRHKYVEKGQDIPSPIKTWGDMAMGGALPGSVGFTYARTKNIPSNGPYAKKTKASAQNGKEMSFYQNGFDWDAKTISQDGTAVNKQSRDMRTLAERKADEAKALDAKLRAQQSSLQKASSPINDERRRQLNEQYAQQSGKRYNPTTGSIEDRFTPQQDRMLNRAYENIVEPMIDAEMIASAAPLVGKGAKAAGKYLTEETALRNAYKINPRAIKENPEMFLYRARPVGQDPNINMAAQLRAKEAAGEPLKWYQKNLMNPQTDPRILAREKYYGQWFEKDPSRLDFYVNPDTRNFADNDVIEILRKKLPKSEAHKLNVSQFDDAKILSASPETEFILPKDAVGSAERFPESSWQQLIQQDKEFNTPHWLRGYKEVPKKKEGGIVKDNNGYWNPKNWGKPVEIGSNNITMQGVDQPLIGISDEGDVQYMQPGEHYKFKGKKVVEYPVAKEGDILPPKTKADYLKEKLAAQQEALQMAQDAQSMKKKDWEAKYQSILSNQDKIKSFSGISSYDDFKSNVPTFTSRIKNYSKDLKNFEGQVAQEQELINQSQEPSSYIKNYLNQYNTIEDIRKAASTKYGYNPSQQLDPVQFVSNNMVKEANERINTNKGFPLYQDPTNEMTCINGVCSIAADQGVDFSKFPRGEGTGVRQDAQGRWIPQYNPTFSQNYEKAGYRILDPNEAPQPGDVSQYYEGQRPHHAEIVLSRDDKKINTFNNYQLTNYGKGLSTREFDPNQDSKYDVKDQSDTKYYRLTPQAAESAAMKNPEYSKLAEGKKKFESSDENKQYQESLKFIENKNAKLLGEDAPLFDEIVSGARGKYAKDKPGLISSLSPRSKNPKLLEKIINQSYKNGGNVNTVAQNGETLLKNKYVGKIETPIANLNLRPIYKDFKKLREEVDMNNCPDGVGCAKQATVNAQKITGLPYESYAPSNASYRDAVAERTGLQNIFDQEGSQKTTANSRANGWKYPNNDDFKNWKAGDIVTLDAGDDLYFPYSAPSGYKNSDSHNVTHNGMIYGFTPEGLPIIKHGFAKGPNKGISITEVLNDDKRVTDLGHGKYAIKSVWRPKEIKDDGTVNSVKEIVDLSTEAGKRKQNTSSNEKFYLKNTNEEKIINDYPVASEFSGANVRLDTKKKLVNLFNDEKLNKDLQYKFGITAEELNNLKPVVYGIFGQESNFNDVDNAGASLKEILGNMIGGNSRGATQIKLKSLTPEERKILNVKKSSDLDNDKTAYKAALLMILNSKKRMDKEVEEGTHPELKNVDENFRAGYYYNSPARAVNSAKQWGNKSKPSHWYNPLSWKNAITTRNRPDIFGGVNPNYEQSAELRMDKGSYPYKLMENAKDLGVDVDFDRGRDLEEVVIRGTNNPKSKFTKKRNGGWLEKYN